MRLFVTIYEDTFDAALRVMRSLPDEPDGVELRGERIAHIDLAAARAATAKPLLLTYRGVRIDEATIQRALAAGMDLVDVEWRSDLDREMVARYRERIVLSHHDYAGMHDVEAIVRDMESFDCAETKLAATPLTFAENERLLRLIGPRTSVIGMAELGLYSRILAPFRGSPLAFVAMSSIAAPGQLTLERALAIYGPDRASLRAEKVFAVAGYPASHSRSPSIHNHLFREKGVPAAYTIASFESFDEIVRPFVRGEPCGLSITAPFKEEAYAFAVRAGAEIGENASACGAVNTLVNRGGHILADNTDVDGFRALPTRGTIAIAGAGGTARAAKVAFPNATLFNRTAGKLGARPLDELKDFDADTLIDTTSGEVDLPLRPGMTYIRAAYATPSPTETAARALGLHVIEGLTLLEAQAVRQHELFMRVFDAN